MTPTALTLRYLRRAGFVADVVERFLPGFGERGQGIRRDWCHFGDLLACHPRERRIVLVQTTALSCLAAGRKVQEATRAGGVVGGRRGV